MDEYDIGRVLARLHGDNIEDVEALKIHK